jgi:hypothetical protein
MLVADSVHIGFQAYVHRNVQAQEQNLLFVQNKPIPLPEIGQYTVLPLANTWKSKTEPKQLAAPVLSDSKNIRWAKSIGQAGSLTGNS